MTTDQDCGNLESRRHFDARNSESVQKYTTPHEAVNQELEHSGQPHSACNGSSSSPLTGCQTENTPGSQNGDFFEQETWVPIFNFEGLYEISSLGRIKSLGRMIDYGSHKKFKPESILITTLRYGYPRLKLSKDGKASTHFVHALMARSFFGDYDGREVEVDHVNGFKQDNRLVNLELVSKFENTMRYLKTKWDTLGADATRGRWRARIRFNGKEIFLGHHKSREAAQDAYYNKFIELRGYAPWKKEV